jgi:hypothetical protein
MESASCQFYRWDKINEPGSVNKAIEMIGVPKQKWDGTRENDENS